MSASKPFAWRLVYRLYLAAMKWEGPVAVKLRARLLDRLLDRRHERLAIQPDVLISRPDRLELGDNVSVNRGCHLSCVGGLVIGNDVSIGHDSSILSSDHGHARTDMPIKTQPVRLQPTRIGDDVLIGCRAVILGGVEIADGCFVGAGAVVTSSLKEPGLIVAGNPARPIGRRAALDRAA